MRLSGCLVMSLHGAHLQHDPGPPQSRPDVQRDEDPEEPCDPNPESLWDVLMRLLEADKCQ